MTIYTVNKVDAAHLETVKAEMLVMGAPVIRAYYDNCNGVYCAFEGSHRLVAAHELGIMPIIEEIEYSDETIIVQIDGYDEEAIISEYIDSLDPSRAYDRHILTFSDEI